MHRFFSAFWQGIKLSFKRSWPRVPFWVWFALAMLYAIVAQVRQG